MNIVSTETETTTSYYVLDRNLHINVLVKASTETETLEFHVQTNDGDVTQDCIISCLAEDHDQDIDREYYESKGFDIDEIIDAAESHVDDIIDTQWTDYLYLRHHDVQLMNIEGRYFVFVTNHNYISKNTTPYTNAYDFVTDDEFDDEESALEYLAIAANDEDSRISECA